MLNIFFDTNSLEVWESKNLSVLFECKIANDYYKVARYISENGLDDKVLLNIPLIVLMEIKHHLHKSHVERRQSFESTLKEIKKSFGSILDFTYEFKYEDSNIEKYVDLIVKEFLGLPINKNLKITPLPSEYENIIERAVKGISPFFSTDNKKASDAGFKDALLLHSILESVNFDEDEVILFTGDYRLQNKNEYLDKNLSEKFFVVSNFDDCTDIIGSRHTLITKEKISIKLESDSYITSRILESIEQPSSDDTKGMNIISINQNENKDEYRVKARIISNEVTFLIEFDYDCIANDFNIVAYTLENE